MSKNINHIQHVKSSVVENGKPKLPQSSVLVDGELAINYASGYETISLKNSSGEVVTFSSDDYYTEQKLGSGFTGANSANTVTSVIESNERVVSTSLNDLNYRLSSHTEDNSIHLSSADKTNLDSLATNIAAISGITTAKVSDWDTAATSAHNHTNKTYLDGISGTVGTMAYEDASSYSSATQINTALNSKASSGDIVNFFDDVRYENSGDTKVIAFYHGNTLKDYIDASEFIIDGMVDDVKIEDVAGSGTCLVIDFNTASGKEDINIPISDIFNANNYYDKDYIDSLVGSGYTSSSITEVIEDMDAAIAAALTDLADNKLDATAYTPTDLSNYYTKSQTSGASEISTALSGKSDTGHTHTLSSITDVTATTSALNSITGSVGTMAFQNTSSYSSATQVSTALNGKSDTSHTHASSAVTTMAGYSMAASGTAITTSDTLNQAIGKLEKQNDEIVDFIETKEQVIAAALTDLDDNKLDVTAYTPTDLSNYYTKSETSGASEISTALSGKSNTGHNHEASAVTAFTDYQIASSSASVLTTDSLLEVIGKLEKRIQLLESSMGGLKLVKISQTDYDNLGTKDSNTLYVIV